MTMQMDFTRVRGNDKSNATEDTSSHFPRESASIPRKPKPRIQKPRKSKTQKIKNPENQKPRKSKTQKIKNPEKKM